MTLIFRVLRAAHATGSHHKLALDALPLLTGDHAERWRRLFLLNAAEYMRGAKAPDDVFKDFKNHVLHTRDGYWGGAPEKVEEWYGTLVASLKAGTWADAAFAAGVLSHYLADPLHPFHTGQTDAENNIHRAVEWSINRAFDDVKAIGLERTPAPYVAITPGAGALRDLVCSGADRANAGYELLIAHYDLKAGVTDPPSGLDAVSRGLVGELIVLATTTIARVLERAFAEAAVAPPEVALTLETVLAVLKIPAKLLAKRLADAEDRRTVQAMFDELMATGRVETTLPEDDRVVREAYAQEVLPRKLAAQAHARQQRVGGGAPVAGTRGAPAPRGAVQPAEALARLAPRPAPVTPTRAEAPGSLMSRLPAAPATPPPLAGSSGLAGEAPELAAAVAASAATQEIRKALATLPPRDTSTAAARSKLYLAASDDLEAAPSIGPKTAESLAVAGLRTIADLIAADPDVVAAQVGNRAITADTVRAWQDQARLVCTIPGLRGTGAQLLVGAGYRSAGAIAEADAGKLCADVLGFAATPAGNRVLRDGQPPDIERIKSWCESAKAVAKAA